MIPFGGVLLLAALASPGPEEPEPAPGEITSPSTVSLAVRLRPSVEAFRAAYTHFGSGSFQAPPNPGSTTPVGLQATRAYDAALARLFRPLGPGAPELQLELQAVAGELEWIGDGWHAVVRHRLALRDAAGKEVGSWRVRGDAAIVGLGESAIPHAFASAAEAAAERFLETFADPPQTADWLRSHGIAPVRYRSRVPGPKPLAAEPGRPDRVAFADLALGLDGMERDLGATYGVRAGLSTGWGLAQLSLSTWSLPAAGARTATGLGLDLAAVLRAWSTAEVVAGVGAQALLDGGPAFEDLTPSFFVAARTARFVSVAGFRFRLGLEVRHHGPGSVQRTAIGLLVGLETSPFGAP